MLLLAFFCWKYYSNDSFFKQSTATAKSIFWKLNHNRITRSFLVQFLQLILGRVDWNVTNNDSLFRRINRKIRLTIKKSKYVKNQDILTQLLIFLASITTTIYAFFSKDSKEAINRTLLLGKFLGSVIVAFFVMPAVMEHFELSIKVTLLITVVVAYGLESILKASVKRVIKTIDKDGQDDTDN